MHSKRAHIWNKLQNAARLPAFFPSSIFQRLCTCIFFVCAMHTVCTYVCVQRTYARCFRRDIKIWPFFTCESLNGVLNKIARLRCGKGGWWYLVKADICQPNSFHCIDECEWISIHSPIVCGIMPLWVAHWVHQLQWHLSATVRIHAQPINVSSIDMQARDALVDLTCIRKSLYHRSTHIYHQLSI